MSVWLHDLLCDFGLYFIGTALAGFITIHAVPYIFRFVVRTIMRGKRRIFIARKKREIRRRDKSVMRWIFRREAICYGGYRLTTR